MNIEEFHERAWLLGIIIAIAGALLISISMQQQSQCCYTQQCNFIRIEMEKMPSWTAQETEGSCFSSCREAYASLGLSENCKYICLGDSGRCPS